MEYHIFQLKWQNENLEKLSDQDSRNKLWQGHEFKIFKAILYCICRQQSYESEDLNFIPKAVSWKVRLKHKWEHNKINKN